MLALGDVLLDRDIVPDAAVGLANGRDRGKFDVFAAILAAIDEFALPHLARGQLVPQRCIDLPGRFAGLQDARVFSDDLIEFVAGDVQKGLIGIFDVAVKVRHNNALRTLLDSLREFEHLIFHGATCADVTDIALNDTYAIDEIDAAHEFDVKLLSLCRLHRQVFIADVIILLQLMKPLLVYLYVFEEAQLPDVLALAHFKRIAEQVGDVRIGVDHHAGLGIEDQNAVFGRFEQAAIA